MEAQQAIPALCEIKNEVQKSIYNINFVDYECITYSKIDESYKLVGIVDGENNNIKNANLYSLNNIILNEGSALTRNTNYDVQDINKMIIFVVNEENKTKFAGNQHVFNFSLIGAISRYMDLDLNTPYEVEVELSNITDKSNNTFYLGKDLNAKLNIYLELKNDKEKMNLTFGNSEIKISNYLVYIPILNELELKNIQELNKETEINSQSSETDNKSKSVTIALTVVFGALGLGGITFGVVYFMKKRKSNIIPDNSGHHNYRGLDNNNFGAPYPAQPLSLNKY